MTRRHVHWPGADLPMTTYESAGLDAPRQLFTDHQGSVVAFADENGANVAVNSYDEYGIAAAANTGRTRPGKQPAPAALGGQAGREGAMAGGGNRARSWTALRAEAMRCTRCDLYKCATRTVFGEGPLDAAILFAGEQPGDREDLAGRPFVGPAGMLLDRALADAGIDRARTYVTNAVKHFKFVRRGKRRIHDKPDAGEIAACRWWLERELALIRPPLIVALGATAARSLFGKAVTIAALRGRGHALAEGEAWVTVHPSFLLRRRDDREAQYARFVGDLARIGERAKVLTR